MTERSNYSVLSDDNETIIILPPNELNIINLYKEILTFNPSFLVFANDSLNMLYL